jgi:hypothetical protein
MELLGIVLALPVAFVASAIYAYVLRFAVKFAFVRQTAPWGSTVVLFGLLLEWVALATMGAVQIRARIGPAFELIHLLIFFLAVPALATLLVIKKGMGESGLGWLFVVALLCSALALPVVLTQYGVTEALYGIDGTGGPYGLGPTIPMPSWW